jgi:hypothetical protein
MVGEQDHAQEGFGLGGPPPATSGRLTALQEGKQGIFSFSPSPEFFERHAEAFVLSDGIGEIPPNAGLCIGGELAEDRIVGPSLKLASHVRQLSNFLRCLHPMLRRGIPQRVYSK